MNRFFVEFRAEVEGNTLRGHAAVFGQIAELANGYEQMAPGAFTAALAAPDVDVRALINHNPELVLGRQSAGTLRLAQDKEGLAFEVDLPDTSYARDLRELMIRGDITGASFGFVPDVRKRSVAPDGKQLTTHVSVERLLDVSPVTWPAYEGASVALRHIEFPRVTARGQAARIRAIQALRRADR
jgi:hypothetical protein